MTLPFDLPECRPSPIQRLDPRWKLAGVLLAALAFALVRTLGPAVLALAGSLVLVAAARVRWDWFLRRLGAAVTMYLLFLIWLPFVILEGHATLDLGVVAISLTGLERLAILSAKLAAMIALMLMMVATTPLHHLFKAARALYAPRLLVALMLMTYRYVFLLIEEFARLRTALRVRGFRNRADLHSYRTIGQVAGTLLVRSHERSERVAQAMKCRGFDGEFRTLAAFRTKAADVLGFAAIAGWAAGLLVWDLLAR